MKKTYIIHRFTTDVKAVIDSGRSIVELAGTRKPGQLIKLIKHSSYIPSDVYDAITTAIATDYTYTIHYLATDTYTCKFFFYSTGYTSKIYIDVILH